ncbi:MAG: tetratricopeptide repeat protein [Calditrichia bacterium]|nr:tetratricopeptide repeat protein [Calditrichia bacterium]
MSKKRLKICANCAHENKQVAKFCEECGASLKELKTVGKTGSNKKNAKTNNYSLVFLGVIVIGIAIVFYYNYQLLKDVGVDKHNHQQSESSSNLGSDIKIPAMNTNVLEAKKAKIKDEPDNIEAIIDLGNFLFDNMQFKEAIAYYQMVLVKNKNLPDIYVEIGVCYFNLNNMNLAEKYFRDALNIKSLHTKAMYNLGIVYYNLNDKDRAVSVWKELINKVPESMEAIQAKRFLNK